MYTQGKDLIKRAVELDQEGKQNEAIPLYKEGCKSLCNDLKLETNPQVINRRVEYLEKHITPCYDEAISLLNKAVQYDQNGEHEEAIDAYLKGCNMLSDNLKNETNPYLVQGMNEKIKTYRSRVDMIRTALNKPKNRIPPFPMQSPMDSPEVQQANATIIRAIQFDQQGFIDYAIQSYSAGINMLSNIPAVMNQEQTKHDVEVYTQRVSYLQKKKSGVEIEGPIPSLPLYNTPNTLAAYEMASKAIEADKNKHYSVALDCYKTATRMYLQEMKNEKNKVIYNDTMNTLNSYLSRAELIKSNL